MTTLEKIVLLARALSSEPEAVVLQIGLNEAGGWDINALQQTGGDGAIHFYLNSHGDLERGLEVCLRHLRKRVAQREVEIIRAQKETT